MIRIQNCNNIISSEIEIEPEYLNIILAPNGTGKSTIAKALFLNAAPDGLLSLKTFGSTLDPSISFDKEFSKVVLFNDDYVKNFLFNNEEVIPGSYDIFIKTKEYERALFELDKLFKGFGASLFYNTKLNNFYDLLKDIAKKIKLSSKENITKTGVVKSILQKKNYHFNFPPNLSKFRSFVENEKVIEWIDWKHQGHGFDSLGKCPFCADQLVADYESEKKEFSEVFSKLDTEYIKQFEKKLQEMRVYLNREKYLFLQRCLHQDISNDDINSSFTCFIKEVKRMTEKIDNIRSFQMWKIDKKRVQDFNEYLVELKINLASFDFFRSKKTSSIMSPLDKKIDELISKTQILLSEINRINSTLTYTAEKAQKDINSFLENSGINYEIEIIRVGDKESQTRLKYIDRNKQNHDVTQIQSHLSWGERNAFALILFMHTAISQQADLIILDDPVSSFDDEKKYAIINRLFTNKGNGKHNSFCGKTVLMLTHDIEPLIDFLLKKKLNKQKIRAHYMINNDGSVKEKEIFSENILSQQQLNWNILIDDNVYITNRLIALRKFIEYQPEPKSRKHQYAYHIISSLLKEKPNPDIKVGHKQFKNLTKYQTKIGTLFIKSLINSFDYQNQLLDFSNPQKIVEEYRKEKCSYFKLQLFRIILNFDNNNKRIENDSLLNFINETYHIENDFFYTIDFTKFDIVPNFIILKCSYFIDHQYLK